MGRAATRRVRVYRAALLRGCLAPAGGGMGSKPRAAPAFRGEAGILGLWGGGQCGTAAVELLRESWGRSSLILR